MKAFLAEMKLRFRGIGVRLAVIAYRDYGDAVRLEKFDFVDDVRAFRQFVAGLEFRGGGDCAEDVNGGTVWETTILPGRFFNTRADEEDVTLKFQWNKYQSQT